MSVQYGGMIMTFQEFMSRLDSPAKLLYGVGLVLTIVYSSIIPSEIRVFTDSLLGRIFGVAGIYIVIQLVGWVYGLLTALAFLLVLNGAPRINNFNSIGLNSDNIEGFDGGGSVSEKKIVGRRWFVEKVLGERPTKIATDKVLTSAIDD
jgi:xanthosine utilization system XapX-like protein